MATPAASHQKQQFKSFQGVLGKGRFVSFAVLSVLLTACLLAIWFTRDAVAHLSFLRNQRSQSGIVNVQSWQIAQALAPLAVTSEEMAFAHEAERLADHDVNQAFAVALRQAAAARPVPTKETSDLSRKVAQLQQTVKDDQARAHTLAGSASDDDAKIAQAQVDLDQDELNDAQHDLARASGDLRGKIQQELAAHQAAVTKLNAQGGNDGQTAVVSSSRYGTLAHRMEAWFNQRARYQLLEQAIDQAHTDAAVLTAQHNLLEAQANASNSSTLAGLEQRREQRQLLSFYDERIQTQAELAGIYGKWANQVLLQHRIIAHLVLQSLAAVAFVLICAILVETLGTRLLERQALNGLTFDRRRIQTLRTILRLGVHILAGICVLLVIFGVPSEISTIVGLATAGLTVALQSFILAFFGWFILMGQNGMRVGDWVEINGVAGEVIEINLFRTTILENSKWEEKGHPTGRRATFINNFAVTGQYFNFTTVGQWMWDEISVNLPSTAEAYGKAALIHRAVIEETQDDARLAELEWKRIPRQNTMSQMSAASSVNLRPSGGSIAVFVRYVTRASERIKVRDRLYDRVIDVINHPPVVITTAQPSKLTAAVLAAKDPADHDLRDRRTSVYT
jgi:small-conductance mechanosensitive channel